MTKRILLSLVFISLTLNLNAQIATDSPLFLELKKEDSLFFERGFNQCDIKYMESRVSADLKFYHDVGGFQDRKVFLERTKNNICGNSIQKPVRKLQPETLEVFALYNDGVLYGAIQSGIHHFYIREKGKEDVYGGTAKFTSVWTKENNIWKLTDILSYDHQEVKAENQTLNKFDKIIQESNVPAMGIGIIENGKLTKVDVYGTLDKQNTAPYNTIFKVASLTKPIFAMTVLKLIDEGLIGLDEPLHKYWIDPHVKSNNWHKKLTPRIILSHQSGFPNWRYLNESNKLEFQFEPGTKYQYSGEGFEYLRKAVENKLGKTIEELAQEYLFKSAKMTNTRFWWDEKMDESLYAKNFDEKGNLIPTEKYYEANSAANLLTTIEDYGSFMTYVMNGAGISEELFQEMQTKQSTVKDGEYFGLGWEILVGFSNDEYALFHTGRDPGVNTLAIMFPKTKNGYLIFMNGDNAMKNYDQILNELYLGNELWEKK
ncbi:serine hydrolase [Moheibacter sediminis]|uniref:CubicO group peptidase, beta-lactamase class C family n=1 Tax=Moheibacter sediminis TaxID=1434700 RepID=A0A1W1ZAD2_9FLAO|nr:serine hydrolase [Moheibacter sediminis]SMC45302.1 CubicO group peptidase, beta-lactamase class C family [Moheibacter sediminis]